MTNHSPDAGKKACRHEPRYSLRLGAMHVFRHCDTPIEAEPCPACDGMGLAGTRDAKCPACKGTGVAEWRAAP